MRLLRLLIVPLMLLAATGCYSESYELISITVKWQPDQGPFRYAIVFKNVGAGLFNCDSTESCVEHMKAAAPGGDFFDLNKLGTSAVDQRL